MKLSLPVMALLALTFGGVGVGGLYYATNMQNQSTAQVTSDSGSIVADFTVGGDPWIGYAALGSPALQSSLRSEGIVFRYDSPNVVSYATRMEQVTSGELDFAVATVDANLLNTQNFLQGGVIVAVLDQSTGGDALVCNHMRINGIDDFSNQPDWKIAFTPDSPSHHLLRAIGNDFGVDALLAQGDWRVEVDGSGAALEALQAGSVDCAVLWQPDVTTATRGSNELGVVYSSGEADGLIVDVLMVHRGHLQPSSPMRPYVQTVLQNYFATVRGFSDDPAFALEQVNAYLREYDGDRYPEADVQAMMAGVSWVNLTENAESWFGVGGANRYYKLEEAHDFACVLIEADEAHGSDFCRRIRPQGFINGQMIAALYESQTITEHNATITDPLELRFTPLSALQWNTLTPQGTLRSRRIVFQPGSNELAPETIGALREAMNDFKRYPRSRLEVRVGFNPTLGDTIEADAAARAAAVMTYLVDTYSIDENRVRVSTQAAPQQDGEGGRAYQSRLREVGLGLLRENNEI